MNRWTSLLLLGMALVANAGTVDLDPPAIFEAHVYNLSNPVIIPALPEDKKPEGRTIDLSELKIKTTGEETKVEITNARVEDDKLKFDLKYILKASEVKASLSTKVPGAPVMKDKLPVLENGKPKLGPETVVEKTKFEDKNLEISFTAKESLVLPLPDSLPLRLKMEATGPVLRPISNGLMNELSADFAKAITAQYLVGLEQNIKSDKIENRADYEKALLKIRVDLLSQLPVKLNKISQLPEVERAIIDAMTKPLPRLALWGDTTMTLVYEKLRVGPPDEKLQRIVWHLRPDRYVKKENEPTSQLTKLWRSFIPERRELKDGKWVKLEGVKPINRVKLGIGGETLTYLTKNYLKALGATTIEGQTQEMPQGLAVDKERKLVTFYASDAAASTDIKNFLNPYREAKKRKSRNYLIGVPTDLTEESRIVRFIPWKSVKSVEERSKEGTVTKKTSTSYLDVAVKFSLKNLDDAAAAIEIVDVLFTFRVVPPNKLELIWVGHILPDKTGTLLGRKNAAAAKFMDRMEPALKALLHKGFSSPRESDPTAFALQALGEPINRRNTNSTEHLAPRGETANYVEALELNYNP
jgi:hypothetical protein